MVRSEEQQERKSLQIIDITQNMKLYLKIYQC